MLATEEKRKSHERRFSLMDQVKALAVVLRDEFGVPFLFYNAKTGMVLKSEAGALDVVSGSTSCLELADVHELASAGRVRVTPTADGRYQLALLLYEAREPVLVACGAVDALAKTAPDIRRELTMLEKWLQAVSDRLRLADQLFKGPASNDARAPQTSQNSAAWEALLSLDHVARRLRLDKDPVKNVQRILEGAFASLGAATLVWVPRNSDNSVQIQGDAGMAPVDYRQLAALLTKTENPVSQSPIIHERFQEKQGSARFPDIANLLALPVLDQELVGWLIAINKKPTAGARTNNEGAPAATFRKSDAALLTPFAALISMHERGIAHCLALKDLLVGLTRSLTTAIDAKDSYTFGHSERVARVAVELGRELGMDNNELGDIYLAGLLHDVGKIGVRDEVLSKPGKLTPEEQAHIQQHVTIGYAILADLRQIRNLLPGVLYHHERYDGRGYPDGLLGEKIPLLARILAVADSYDAMTTARPYREAMALAKVEQIITDGAGTQWDARIVDAFNRCRQKIHTIRQRGVGESLRQAIDGAIRSDSDSRNLSAKEPGKSKTPSSHGLATLVT